MFLSMPSGTHTGGHSRAPGMKSVLSLQLASALQAHCVALLLLHRFQSGQVPEAEKPPTEVTDVSFSFAGDGSMEKVFTAALKELQQNAKVGGIVPCTILSFFTV